jgi:hypothetical protein
VARSDSLARPAPQGAACEVCAVGARGMLGAASPGSYFSSPTSPRAR